MARFLPFIAIVSLCVSCNIIETHPYDVNIPAKYAGTNQKNKLLIEQSTKGKSVLKFILMGDTQRHYDDTEEFVKAANALTDIDFIIHGGDITDFGQPKEYMWMHDILAKLRVPYVTVIGNHDILGTGEYTYRKIYGELNFAFLAGGIQFVCINTNALESSDVDTVPDFLFLDKQVDYTNSTNSVKSTIVVMHSPPFDIQLTNNQVTLFHQTMKNMRNLRFCLHAHTHQQTVKEYFNDGVKYYSTSNIESRTYMLFTVSENDYSYEVVEF